MKIILLVCFSFFSHVNAGKLSKLMTLAALNGGGLGIGANPGLLAGGLNPQLAVLGGAGLVPQPQFVQFVPRFPAFGVAAPVPNMYPAPAANMLPYFRGPQVPQVNPLQQPMGVLMGGSAQQQQQLPPPPDVLPRFRRQILAQENTVEKTEDTQIPAPGTAEPACDGDHPAN